MFLQKVKMKQNARSRESWKSGKSEKSKGSKESNHIFIIRQIQKEGSGK